MTEPRLRPIPLNIAWILNTLFVLATTFLLGASYGMKRTVHELQPAIYRNQEDLLQIQSSLRATEEMNAATTQRQQDIERNCLQLLGGRQ